MKQCLEYLSNNVGDSQVSVLRRIYKELCAGEIVSTGKKSADNSLPRSNYVDSSRSSRSSLMKDALAAAVPVAAVIAPAAASASDMDIQYEPVEPISLADLDIGAGIESYAAVLEENVVDDYWSVVVEHLSINVSPASPVEASDTIKDSIDDWVTSVGAVVSLLLGLIELIRYVRRKMATGKTEDPEPGVQINIHIGSSPMTFNLHDDDECRTVIGKLAELTI